MADPQYVRCQTVGQVIAAEVLREKITEHENQAVLTELTTAGDSTSWRMAVDLSQVMFLSSAGLGGLVTLNKRAVAGGGKLVIHGVQESILQLLKLTRLDKLLTIEPTRDAAIKRAAS